MSRPSLSLLRATRTVLGIALLLALSALSVQAQGNFQSGSTGADGAFNLTTTQTIAVPESGVFNFTTVTIPSGVTVTFIPNSSNTPLTILASGDVVISGTINVAGRPANANGTGGLGGPGGFAGGNAGFGVTDLFSGQNGSGPGGGRGGAGNITFANVMGGSGGGYASAGSGPSTNPTTISSTYGSGLIQPLIGGSGGGGGGTIANGLGGAGGGGGGAILIASSTNITLNSTGLIDASGGAGGNGVIQQAVPGGSGSGGAVRLIANIISGNGGIRVNGGTQGSGAGVGGRGGLGYVRAEGFTLTNFTPVINSGANPGQPTVASLGLPNPVILANAPEVKILSVAGINAPTNPKGTLQSLPDILVPNTQTNPVLVELEGRNLPANTAFTVTVTPSTGTTSSISNVFTSTVNPVVFAGNAQINLPAGLSVISATAIVDLLLAGISDMTIDGEKIVKMEINATYGQDPQISYITDKGKRIVK